MLTNRLILFGDRHLGRIREDYAVTHHPQASLPVRLEGWRVSGLERVGTPAVLVRPTRQRVPRRPAVLREPGPARFAPAAVMQNGSSSGRCYPERFKTRRDRHFPGDSKPSYTALYRKYRWFPRSFTLTMSSQGAASGRNSTPAISPGRSGDMFRPAS